MSDWVVSLFFGVGVSGWAYAKLVHANGNPTPYQDLGGAAIAGVLAFVVFFTILKSIMSLV